MSNEKFESWKELFDHVKDGRPYLYEGTLETVESNDYYNLSAPLIEFSKPNPKPEPKKLYAYRYGDSDIVFYNKEQTEGKGIRSPEYDITYPVNGD